MTFFKRYRKSFLISSVVLGLGAGAWGLAHADHGPGCFGGMGHMGHGPMAGFGPGAVSDRLDELHKKLNLKAEQEAAWKTWSTSVKQRLDSVRQEFTQEREKAGDWSKMPAPERVERMLSMSQKSNAALSAGLAELKTFYGTLTPEQKKTFDDNFMPRGRHAWRGHRGSESGGRNKGGA